MILSTIIELTISNLKIINIFNSSRKTEGPTSSRPLPSVNWSQIVGMVEPLQTCTTKQLKEFQDEYTSKVNVSEPAFKLRKFSS